MADNLLSVPIRRTDSISVRSGFQKCIESEYNQLPDKFARDIDIVERARQEIVSTADSDDSLRALARYYSLVTAVAAKFPDDIRVDFVWYGTLGYATNAAVSYRSIQFERINVCYNIGAVYSQLAYKCPRDSEGLKRAYQYFQLAAGSFRLLIDQVLPEYSHELPLALDHNTLESLMFLCLAQGQECFWLKAVTDGLKDINIAKLATQAAEYYRQSHVYAQKSSILKVEWIDHIAFKQFHFLAAAQYRASVHCLSKSKYGEEISRLRACIELCTKAHQHSKYVSPTVHDDLSGLQTRAKSDLTRAEKDNDLIYLQDVPQQGALPPIGASDVCKPLESPAVKLALTDLQGNAAPFISLLPYMLYQAAKAFAEKIVDYVNSNVLSTAATLTSNLHDELSKLDLPAALDAAERPLGIPDSILGYSEELQAHGGLERLRRSLQDIHVLATDSRSILKTAGDTLATEEQEDTHLRSIYPNWIRPTSAEAAADLSDQVAKFEAYLTEAEKSNGEVFESMESIEYILVVLGRGRKSIEELLPESTATTLSPYLEKAMSELREAISEARRLEVQRGQYMRSLQATIAKIDLREYKSGTLTPCVPSNPVPEIITRYKALQERNPTTKVTVSQLEGAYTASLGQFDKDLLWVQEQQRQQSTIVTNIQRKNTTFRELYETSSASSQRHVVIQNLERAYTKYTSIRASVEQARNFYNSVTSQLHQLQDACNQFMYQRRAEGASLERSLRTPSQSQERSYEEPSRHEPEGSSDTSLPAPKPRRAKPWDLQRGMNQG